MDLRAYRDEDSIATRSVFGRAVHATASANYTEEQLRAWAPVDLDDVSVAEWAAARAAARTVVAVEEGGELLGFGDLVNGSVLDMLYVDPSAGRRGVGSRLIEEIVGLARAGGAAAVETDASLTARALMERHGFHVIAEQTPVVNGVAMTNFKMRLTLARVTNRGLDS